MAEMVAKDVVFYTAARANPVRTTLPPASLRSPSALQGPPSAFLSPFQELHFPQLFAFMQDGLRMGVSGSLNFKREDLKRRVLLGLEKAEEVVDKWNATTWMRPHHLFGLLCQEKRRRRFAVVLLAKLGYAADVKAALAAANPAAGSGEQQLLALMQLSVAQQDAADVLLIEKLDDHWHSGSLEDCLRLHGLLQRGASRESCVLSAGVQRELPSPPLSLIHI